MYIITHFKNVVLQPKPIAKIKPTDKIKHQTNTTVTKPPPTQPPNHHFNHNLLSQPNSNKIKNQTTTRATKPIEKNNNNNSNTTTTTTAISRGEGRDGDRRKGLRNLGWRGGFVVARQARSMRWVGAGLAAGLAVEEEERK